MIRTLTPGAIALAVAALGCSPSFGQSEPARQTTHEDWEVYRADTNDGAVCFAATRPTDAVPAAMDHDGVYFLVSRWRGRPREQASFHAPYDLSPMRAPEMEIGSDDFVSYAAGQEAFVPDEDEPELIEAMRKGANMRVEAHTGTGDLAVYEFSLSGVTAAIRDLERLC